MTVLSFYKWQLHSRIKSGYILSGNTVQCPDAERSDTQSPVLPDVLFPRPFRTWCGYMLYPAVSISRTFCSPDFFVSRTFRTLGIRTLVLYILSPDVMYPDVSCTYIMWEHPAYVEGATMHCFSSTEAYELHLGCKFWFHQTYSTICCLPIICLQLRFL